MTSADPSATLPLILLWDDLWIDVDEARSAAAGSCRISIDRSDFDRADAVVFPVPITGHRLPTTRASPRQVWVQWSQESAVHYPLLRAPSFDERFDLRMTYRLDSDVPIPYFAPDIFESLPALVPIADRRDVLVSAWVSSRHDRCGRDDYLRGLMGSMPVHSYGRVGRNIRVENDTGQPTKLATIARYRFTLALENAVDRDYVTEKFFQPLQVGSVPVYRGAGNVARFAPAPSSYIDADDFPGPAALAQFLQSMTDEQYAGYHEWRDRGPRRAWRARFAPFRTHAFVRLAHAVRVVAIGLSAAAANDRGDARPRSSPRDRRPPGESGR